jgi:hypothetical protein
MKNTRIVPSISCDIKVADTTNTYIKKCLIVWR